MEVQWDPSKLCWQRFRAKILGATDPLHAEAGSLRSDIHGSWHSLGLAKVTDTANNGVHGSASPFEALADRVNWLGVAIHEDPYGKALIAMGIPYTTIRHWC